MNTVSFIISLIIPLAVIIFMGVVIAGIATLVVRARNHRPITFTFRHLVSIYFNLLTIAGLIVMVIGLSSLVNAGLSQVLGKEFSFQAPPLYKIEPPPAPEIREPLPYTKERYPSLEEQRAQRERQLEEDYRDSLLRGTSLSLVGGLVWGLHLYGRRRYGDGAEGAFFNMAYLAILLAIFSIVSIVALPQAVYQTLRFYIIPADEFTYLQAPGPMLAASIVFVPFWIYYLLAFLGELRREREAA